MHTPEVTLLHRIVSGADGAGIDGELILGRMRTLWATSSALPTTPVPLSGRIETLWETEDAAPDGAVVGEDSDLLLSPVRPDNVLCLALQLHVDGNRVADLMVPWGGVGVTQSLPAPAPGPTVRVDSGAANRVAGLAGAASNYRWSLGLHPGSHGAIFVENTRVLVFAQHELPVV